MKKLTVETQINDTIHYALQQNCIPIIRKIVLTNQSKEQIVDVTVRITFEPEFAVPYEVRVAQLNPQEPTELSAIRLYPSMEYLLALREGKKGKLNIEVLEGKNVLKKKSCNIQVLAFSQWSGIEKLPEMIAAYSTPAHPNVKQLIEKAKVYLNTWGVKEFTGYQVEKEQELLLQMKAIYLVLQDEELELSIPKESYETNGQLLTLPHWVLEQKSGTALELSLIFSSCLEAINLHPVIVFMKGHAFIGCHSKDKHHGECLIDEVSELMKQDGEENAYHFLECTDFVRDHQVDFVQAGEDARKHLLNQEMFHLCVDLYNCRLHGISSLPLPSMKQDSSRADYRESSERNPLLNIPVAYTSIQLMTANLFELQEKICTGETFTLVGKAKEFINLHKDQIVYPIEKDAAYMEAIATREFSKHCIRTFLSEEQLKLQLNNIHRQLTVIQEEEEGRNLYLVIGGLRFGEGTRERLSYAPLLFVPVDLVLYDSKEAYGIVLREEEIRLNEVLLRHIQKEYGMVMEELQTLPRDESGVDLSYIFRTIRKKIEGKKDWKVEEYVFLDLFPYSRYLIEKDRKEYMGTNTTADVFSRIIKEEGKENGQMNQIHHDQIDLQAVSPDLLIPLPADQSQLEAIHTAAKGQSFLLQGAPGTGKKQTIANMITNAIAHEKTVLYVTKKKNAADRLYRFLGECGIQPFCLYLYDGIAHKNELLHKLEASFQLEKKTSKDEYEQLAAQTIVKQQEFHQIMEAIHKERAYGMSLYEAFLRYEEYKEWKGLVEVEDCCIARLKKGVYEEWLDTVLQCQTVNHECQGSVRAVFAQYRNPEYTLEIRESFAKICRELKEDFTRMEKMFQSFEKFFGIHTKRTYQNYKAFAELLYQLSGAKYQLDSLMLEPVNERKEKNLYNVINCGKELVLLEKELNQIFQPSIYEYDSVKAAVEWKTASTKWFFKKIRMQSRLLKQMQEYAKMPIDIDRHTIEMFFGKLGKRQELVNYLTNLESAITSSFSYLWQGIHTNWEILEQAVQDTWNLRSCFITMELTRDEVITITQKLGELVALQSGKKELLQKDIMRYLQCWQRCMSREVQLTNEYRANIDCYHKEEDWIEKTIKELEGWLTHIGELRDWSVLMQQVEKIRDYGFDKLADLFLSGRISGEQLVPIFVCNVNMGIIKRIIQAEPLLAQAQGVPLEERIELYGKCLEELSQFSKKEAYARVVSRIPTGITSGVLGEEQELLRLQLRQGLNKQSVGELFGQIPNLLARIYPCLLMSPTTVAQYLVSKEQQFDYVILDDASDFTTAESIGAIARGKHVIVVGDRMQLPPLKRDDREGAIQEEYLDNGECIMEECIVNHIQVKELRWHYRSEKESLFSYSNQWFYHDHIMTYPAVNEEETNVAYQYVEGYYDGENGWNRGEAEAIVKDVWKRLRNKGDFDQIGIITFQVEQQQLIEDLLKQELETPQLRRYKDILEKRVWVKEVEHAQTKECDMVYLSVGYGKDQNGMVSMDFGRLKEENGERWMNAAITRARKGVVLYASVMPDELEQLNTRHQGILFLQGYMRLAMQGKTNKSLQEAEYTLTANQISRRHKASIQNGNSSQAKRNIYVQEIVHQIERLGYQVRCFVGCSDFTIDIGVLRPGKKQTYLLGILLSDMEQMEQSSVKEWMYMQPKHLKELGWNICHIWLLDWLDNPQKVMRKVQLAIQHVVNTSIDNGELREKVEQKMEQDEIAITQ